MIGKYSQKLNLLFERIKQQQAITNDSLTLISANLSRSKINKKKTAKKGQQYTYISRGEIDAKQQQLLLRLYKAKCVDLKIDANKTNQEFFIKSFLAKNKMIDSKYQSITLNLSDFELGMTCSPLVNQLMHAQSFQKLNLSGNCLSIKSLNKLHLMKQIVLMNCGLDNIIMDFLFRTLQESSIEKLVLSSPNLKNRNKLTKYDSLMRLIKVSKTLKILGLANIQINSQSNIIQNCKDSSIEEIDLSNNTQVSGICPTLKNINLSHNSITKPFNLPLTVCGVTHLNLSYNKIPSYHFKEFLKIQYFPNLYQLILDHVNFSGQAYAIQFYCEQATRFNYLSMVDCDLSADSFCHVLNGIKLCKSLRKVNLTRNRIGSVRVAESISSALQLSHLQSIQLRHCDIKDELGCVMIRNIRKNKYLQEINLENNLLGGLTSRAICEQLKYAKNISLIHLQQNIVTYKDMKEISTYFVGNRYHGQATLRKQYQKIEGVNRQCLEVNKALSQEQDNIQRLQNETQKLEELNYNLSKVDNQSRKIILKKEIQLMRELQGKVNRRIQVVENEVDQISMQNSESLRDTLISISH